MKAPQIILIIFLTFKMAGGIFLHDKSSKVIWWGQLIDIALITGLLWWGGFWG